MYDVTKKQLRQEMQIEHETWCYNVCELDERGMLVGEHGEWDFARFKNICDGELFCRALLEAGIKENLVLAKGGRMLQIWSMEDGKIEVRDLKPFGWKKREN